MPRISSASLRCPASDVSSQPLGALSDNLCQILLPVLGRPTSTHLSQLCYCERIFHNQRQPGTVRMRKYSQLRLIIAMGALAACSGSDDQTASNRTRGASTGIGNGGSGANPTNGGLVVPDNAASGPIKGSGAAGSS